MKEELKNLTPEMVEELKQLGVEFEDTQDVWFKYLNEEKYRQMSKCYCSNTTYNPAIPAPNLSEILEKLPKVISKKDMYGEPREYLLNVYGFSNGEWNIAYDDSFVHQIGRKVNKCILTASYELLKWIATNYPENLKGGQSDE